MVGGHGTEPQGRVLYRGCRLERVLDFPDNPSDEKKQRDLSKFSGEMIVIDDLHIGFCEGTYDPATSASYLFMQRGGISHTLYYKDLQGVLLINREKK